MATPGEMRTLVKKLQAATTDSERIDILETLKKDAVVSESLLRETKAGLAVGKLRQHANPTVVKLSKELVGIWKAAVDRDKVGRSDGKAPAPAKGPVRKNSTTPAPQTPITPTIKASSGPARTAKTDGVKFNGATPDKTRDKCIELMYDALVLDSTASSDVVAEHAKAVEAAVLAANDGSSYSAGYKTRIRQLMVNLKDKANPWLRESVVSGKLAADRLATMSTEDMASPEMKAEKARIQGENLFNSLAAHEQEAETDAFTCGRCKQSKCRYRQAQTRSADEPMTTFVTCTNCGHRWKFS